jgi:hypothetical protein
MRQVRFKRILGTSIAGLLFGLSFGLASPAAAQAPPQRLDPQQACQPDAFRLCNEAIPDRGKVAACLMKNRRRLSPACHMVIYGETRKARRHVRRHYRHHR